MTTTCPGHWEFMWTGPGPDDVDPDIYVCSGTCQCVEAKGVPTAAGYGQLKVNGKSWLAHRYAWTQANGPIPDGMYVCHRCDNRACINVDHLFLGTHTDKGRR